ncbi:hypothetical protein GHT74_32750, partial [Pseudomonas aeruginosa]|nr:hypothetical protein [Pseudomonas aeruginosa]MBG4717610.1 hypothetical protein [Pseudomonas aeruginosa]MBG4803389.1 hypothetical protein [Pseudomonas aeruginosa]MBG5051149.1 hypothetical protein [Pseudomonas aeruginosa]MBG5069539.1 hypothetical protein [Pseudomonas aeruginosa]
YELVKNWRETYAALEQLATSPEFRQQFGDNYLKGLEERAAFLANKGDRFIFPALIL